MEGQEGNGRLFTPVSSAGQHCTHEASGPPSRWPPVEAGKEEKGVQTKELQYGAVFIFGERFLLAVISGTGND